MKKLSKSKLKLLLNPWITKGILKSIRYKNNVKFDMQTDVLSEYNSFHTSSKSTIGKTIFKSKSNSLLAFNTFTNKEELEKMFAISKSYEALFSRRAIKYKTMGLKEKTLTENDYKNLILNEYTFLKRPVFINDHEIYIGNSKKTIELYRSEIGQHEQSGERSGRPYAW